MNWVKVNVCEFVFAHAKKWWRDCSKDWWNNPKSDIKILQLIHEKLWWLSVFPILFTRTFAIHRQSFIYCWKYIYMCVHWAKLLHMSVKCTIWKIIIINVNIKSSVRPTDQSAEKIICLDFSSYWGILHVYISHKRCIIIMESRYCIYWMLIRHGGPFVSQWLFEILYKIIFAW